MKFSGHDIPDSLFELARTTMRARGHFTPEDIRQVLITEGRATMVAINGIERNHRIIADRVMRKVVQELAAAGEYAQLKRGVWMKSSVLAAAKAPG